MSCPDSSAHATKFDVITDIQGARQTRYTCEYPLEGMLELYVAQSAGRGIEHVLILHINALTYEI